MYKISVAAALIASCSAVPMSLMQNTAAAAASTAAHSMPAAHSATASEDDTSDSDS